MHGIWTTNPTTGRLGEKKFTKNMAELTENKWNLTEKKTRKSLTELKIHGTRKEIKKEIEKREKTNIIISKENDCVSKPQLEEEFDEIWKEYPKKQGKANALKSYIKARKKGTTKDDVIKGLVAYLQYIKIEKVDQQYIKHGSTWFNQECWNDDYTIRRNITTKDLADAGTLDFSKFRS